MAKLSKADSEDNKQRERKNKNRLKSVKSDFLAGNIKSFQQIYDVVAISWIAEQLGMGFTTLKSKSNSPGDFSLNEIKRFADLIGVDFDDLLIFIKALIKQPKSIKK
jgi:hypothetical protein